MGVEIVEDDVKLPIREHGNEAVHKAQELDIGRRLEWAAMIPPGGHFQCCEHIVAPLVMAVPGGYLVHCSTREYVMLKVVTGVLTALFVSGFTLAYAQDGEHRKPSLSDLSALTDARIGVVKAALQLTPEQQKY